MNFRNWELFLQLLRNSPNITNVIVRCDLNIPSDIEDFSRIYVLKNTIKTLLNLKLNIILISHYKRPKKNEFFTDKFSLKAIAEKIANIINEKVEFNSSSVWDLTRTDIKSQITLLENLRFYEEEKNNDFKFASKLASLADVYINEAFSVSHRAHASISAITNFLPSFAGIAFENEINNISKAMYSIERPYSAIIGGSKVSSKIDVLREIAKKADYLIIAGAMANTFLKAIGNDVGNSLCEPDCLNIALDIYKNSTAKIILPIDFMVSKNINSNGICSTTIKQDESCFDIGAESIQLFCSIIEQTKTLLWNGAIGAFEFANFGQSSQKIASFVSEKTKLGGLYSIIGGGETVASIGQNNMSFVSNAGGAFLEYIAGYELPGIVALSCNE